MNYEKIQKIRVFFNLINFIFHTVYHWCEVKMKMYVMNIGKSGQKATIPKLNEEAAIELGASLLGKVFLSIYFKLIDLFQP